MDEFILKTYNNLLKFSSTVLTLEKKIVDNRIENFENEIGFSLPKDFKYFIKNSNGFSLRATSVNGIGEEYLENSLDKIYAFEHYETGNPMPQHFLPFSPDGFGNFYCLDLSRIENETCPIIFWQHDFIYDNLDEVETCNKNFAEWVNEVMIEWTLEEINFDGIEK